MKKHDRISGRVVFYRLIIPRDFSNKNSSSTGDDLTVDEQKVAFLREASGMVAELPDDVRREVYAMRLAEMTGVSQQAIQDQVAQVRKRKLRAAKRDETREQLRPVMQQQKRSGVRFDNARSAAAEAGVIRVLYQDPALFSEVEPPDPADFSSPELRHLYTLLLEKIRQNLPVSPAALSEALTPAEMNLLTTIISESDDSGQRKKALTDYIQIICREAMLRGDIDLNALARQRRGETKQ